MAKSKFKVTEGLAQLITTGEPVFVLGFSERRNQFEEVEKTAIVIRPVVTQNGIEHREETIPLDQLETRFEQAKRTIEFEAMKTVEFEQAVQKLREEAENKRYALPVGVKQLLEEQKSTEGTN